jgi:hypothetical protein
MSRFGSRSGAGSGAFNGNRTVTRPGLPNVNVGGENLEEWADEYFFPASAPTLAVSIANNVREKGTTFQPTIVADYTPKYALVVARRLYRNGALITQPATDDFSYQDIVLSATTIYRVQIDYTLEGVPGTLSKDVGVYFFAPTYIFLGALNMSEAQIKAAAGVSGKRIIDRQSLSDISYTGNNTHPAIAEPASYNGFSTIKDQNGFVVTSGFSTRLVEFALADGTTKEMYRIREHVDETSVNGFKYNFLR